MLQLQFQEKDSGRKMKYQVPQKPKTMKAQVDILWSTTHNHVLTTLSVQDLKLNFILAFMALQLVVTGVIATLVVIL